MNNRERITSVLRYEEYDRLPIVHFGFLDTAIRRWADEGHIPHEDIPNIYDATPAEDRLGEKLGFDCTYYRTFSPDTRLNPVFKTKVLEELPDGRRKVFTSFGTHRAGQR